MGSEKRARQKEGRRARLEAERRIAQRVKWRRRVVLWSLVAAAAAAVFLVGNLITGRDPAPPPPVVTDTTLPGAPIPHTDTTASVDSLDG